mmetsp:Transcript_2303/g.3936  ORF Transcript_2303/g.3936 Transcript_2303/m.3936 type:complete len:252 (-) Transcript_2303:8-763(-)
MPLRRSWKQPQHHARSRMICQSGSLGRTMLLVLVQIWMVRMMRSRPASHRATRIRPPMLHMLKVSSWLQMSWIQAAGVQQRCQLNRQTALQTRHQAVKLMAMLTDIEADLLQAHPLQRPVPLQAWLRDADIFVLQVKVSWYIGLQSATTTASTLARRSVTSTKTATALTTPTCGLQTHAGCMKPISLGMDTRTAGLHIANIALCNSKRRKVSESLARSSTFPVVRTTRGVIKRGRRQGPTQIQPRTIQSRM